MSELVALWEALPFLRNALIVGVVVGSLAPWIGSYFVLRRILLLGITIPQVSSAGIAFVLLVQGIGLFGSSATEAHLMHGLPLIGAVAFTLVAISILGRLAQRRPELADAAIGFTFALSSALSILLLSQSPMAEASMLNLLKGEIIAMTNGEVIGTGALAIAVFTVLILSRGKFLLISYDREFAITMGMRVAGWDILFYLVAGVGVSLSVMTVGPIATFGYLVLPPMIALRITHTMTQLFVAASVIGAVTSLIALATAFVFDLPTGPTSVALLAIIYLITSFTMVALRLLTGNRAEIV